MITGLYPAIWEGIGVGGGVEWASSNTEHATGVCVHGCVHLSE